MARVRTTHEVDPATIDDNAQSPEIAIFAKTLNRLMVEKCVHQDDMAQALGIATGSISAYRNGKKEPRLSMIAKIANYLGVDCHYLMTGIQAKNYICSNELGLSEKAISRLHEVSEYIKAHPSGFVPNPYDVLLAFDGPEFTMQPEGKRVSASKVFEVSLTTYLHERATEVGPDGIAGLDDEDNTELLSLAEQLAVIGYTVAPKQVVTASMLQDACDALRALFQGYGDNMRGSQTSGKR